jgi:rfaE bifunctional protein nucleotidyltransferase chain/domain
VGEVVSREQLLAHVRGVREAGGTIALADGAFDLLTAAHVRYLESTAQEADLLVVGVASDATVTRLEGEGRPILAAEHRAALVAALRCVDFVVVYREPTVGAFAAALHPDVHRAGSLGTES